MRVPTGLHPTSCNPLPVFLFVMHHAISAIPSNVMHPTLFLFVMRHAISPIPSNVMHPTLFFCSSCYLSDSIQRHATHSVFLFVMRHAISVIPSNVLQPIPCFSVRHAISAIPSNVLQPTLFFCSSCVMLPLRFHPTSCNPLCFSVRHASRYLCDSIQSPATHSLFFCSSCVMLSLIPSNILQLTPGFSVRHAISVIPSNVLQLIPCFSVRRASCYPSDVFFHNLP